MFLAGRYIPISIPITSENEIIKGRETPLFGLL
jgi:hypothetical protein